MTEREPLLPQGDTETTRAVYEEKAEEIAAHFDSIGARTTDVEFAFTMLGKRNPRVVEIGCGNGRDAGRMLAWTDDYVGIDTSERMIELARRKQPHGRFEVADLSEYEYPEQTDIIFSFASLVHADEAEVRQCFANAQPALSEGGIVYLSLKYGEGRVVKQDDWGIRVFHHYTPIRIIDLAGEGYEPIYQHDQTMGGTEWFTQVLRKT